jgi:crossover junction endodeoxyribonuclease RuvC
VQVLLPRARFDSDDSADALAVAITHAHSRGIRALRTPLEA